MLVNKGEMLEIGAAYCGSLQPDTQRLVIVQEFYQGKLLTTGVRYQNGKWRRELNGERLVLHPAAVWSESIIPDVSDLALIPNEKQFFGLPATAVMPDMPGLVLADQPMPLMLAA